MSGFGAQVSPSVTQWTLVDHGMGLMAIPHYILGAYSGGIRMLWSEGCMSTLAVGMELLKESRVGKPVISVDPSSLSLSCALGTGVQLSFCPGVQLSAALGTLLFS